MKKYVKSFWKMLKGIWTPSNTLMWIVAFMGAGLIYYGENGFLHNEWTWSNYVSALMYTVPGGLIMTSSISLMYIEYFRNGDKGV